MSKSYWALNGPGSWSRTTSKSGIPPSLSARGWEAVPGLPLLFPEALLALSSGIVFLQPPLPLTPWDPQ